MLIENQIAKEIVDAAYNIHCEVGPGLLESVYENILAFELNKRTLKFTKQQEIPIVYQNNKISSAFRADIIVEDKVIIEIKSVIEISMVHKKQLKTYLRLANKRLGLLINFNTALIKNGIIRVANGMPH